MIHRVSYDFQPWLDGVNSAICQHFLINAAPIFAVPPWHLATSWKMSMTDIMTWLQLMSADVSLCAEVKRARTSIPVVFNSHDPSDSNLRKCSHVVESEAVSWPFQGCFWLVAQCSKGETFGSFCIWPSQVLRQGVKALPTPYRIPPAPLKEHPSLRLWCLWHDMCWSRSLRSRICHGWRCWCQSLVGRCHVDPSNA